MRTTLQDLQRAVQAGNYYLSRQYFLELLVEPDAPLPQVFCEMSVAEYQHGNLRTALTFAEAGEKLLVNQPTPDPGLLARLRVNLVNFYRETGDVARSIAAGIKWLDELGNNPLARYRRGRIYYNLALAYRQRGGPRDNAEALRYYDMARIHFRQVRESDPVQEERERSLVYEIMTLQNEAWLFCEIGDIPQAQEFAGLAAKLMSGTQLAQQREQVLLSAYLAYSNGNVGECLSLLDDLQLNAEKALARQQFWAEWLASRVYLSTSGYMLAGVHATLAASEAERTKEVYLMRLAAELDKEVKAAG